MLYGAIEAGGTKFICAVSDEKLNIIEKINFPTSTPNETIPLIISFFRKYEANLKSIGIGSFGPIDINKDSSTYGYITSTPKQGWTNFDFKGSISKEFNIPIAWTTDVNAATYGEYKLGHGRNKSTVVYITIGTGIGGGVIQNGSFIGGLSHLEIGHMLIAPHKEDNFEGNCSFHNKCLEGLAAGPAIEKRLNIKGQLLPKESSYWNIEAYYIAQCAYNVTLMFSPEIIILGGGVMQQPHILEKIKKEFQKILNSYVEFPKIDSYIVTPYLGNDAGILGGLALAENIINS